MGSGPAPAALDFSIIVPTRDRHEHLAACLDAIGRLRYPASRFEVVVVDDGSRRPVTAPATGALQVTVLRQARGGPALARNLGAAAARGRFLAFTDDDCAPTTDWLDRLAERLNGAAGHVVGGRTVNALADNVFSAASQTLLAYLYEYYSSGPDRMWFFASSNLALDAEGFRAVGGFDPGYPHAAAEDRDLCDRLRDTGYRMSYAPEAVVHHRHALTPASFWSQHYRYGCGAGRFWKIRRERSGEGVSVEPPGFYTGLLRSPFRQGVRRPLAVAALLVVSQIANAAGFLSEWAAQRQTAG